MEEKITWENVDGLSDEQKAVVDNLEEGETIAGLTKDEFKDSYVYVSGFNPNLSFYEIFRNGREFNHIPLIDKEREKLVKTQRRNELIMNTLITIGVIGFIGTIVCILLNCFV